MAPRWWEVGPPFTPAIVPASNQTPGASGPGGSLGNGIYGAPHFVRNNELWVIGGDRFTGARSFGVISYNLETNKWTHEFDLDRSEIAETKIFDDASAAYDAANDVVYFAGQNGDRFYKLDIGTRVTTILPSLTVDIFHRDFVWVNGKVYGNLPTATPQVFDPIAGTWSGIASWAHGSSNQYSPACVYNGEIYVLVESGAFARYDPVGNSWTTLASLGTGNSGGRLLLIGSDIYRVGGLNSSFDPTTTVDVFDAVGGTWSVGDPMVKGADGLVGGVLHGFIVVAGGYDLPSYNYNGRTAIYGDGQYKGRAEVVVEYAVKADTVEIEYDSKKIGYYDDTTPFMLPVLPDQLSKPITYYDEPNRAFHVLGGEDPNAGFAPTVRHFVFDVDSRTWSESAALPQAVSSSLTRFENSVLIGDKVYFVDGVGQNVFEFDSTLNTITNLNLDVAGIVKNGVWLDDRDGVTIMFVVQDAFEYWYLYNTSTGVLKRIPFAFSAVTPDLAFIHSDKLYWVASQKLQSFSLIDDSYTTDLGVNFLNYENYFVQGDYLYAFHLKAGPVRNRMLKLKLSNLPARTTTTFDFTDQLPFRAFGAMGSDVAWFAASTEAGGYDQFFAISGENFVIEASVEVEYSVLSDTATVEYAVAYNTHKVVTVEYGVLAGFNARATVTVEYDFAHRASRIVTVVYDTIEDDFDGSGFVEIGTEYS